MAISICDVHTNERQKDTTPYGNIAFPAACYEDNMQEMKVPIHWHDEYEYIFAVKGTVTVFINAEHIRLNEGDSVFINSGCLHGVESVKNKESILRSLTILPKLIGGTAESVFSQKLVIPLNSKTAPSFIILNENSDWQSNATRAMLTAWDAITNEIYDFENESRYQISKAIRLLIDHMFENKVSYRSNDTVLEQIKVCLSYIEENYMNDISNPDLMNLCNWSESVLLRNFRQVTGTSPMQYIINHRIQKATEMLITTDLKSCDIALSCGFHDFSYFTKTFKRIMNMTPVEYRKKIR